MGISDMWTKIRLELELGITISLYSTYMSKGLLLRVYSERSAYVVSLLLPLYRSFKTKREIL